MVASSLKKLPVTLLKLLVNVGLDAPEIDKKNFIYSSPRPRVFLTHYFYIIYSMICRPSDHTVGRLSTIDGFA